MKAAIVVLVILLILAFVLGSAFVGRRNQMAIKRETVNAAYAHGQNRRERPTGFRVEPLAGDRRKLPATEIQREFHAPAG